MKSREIARGGLLTAAAVALLWFGGVSPWFSVFACLAAGVTSAVPLLRDGRVKTAVLLFIAASVLSALIVPRKALVFAYTGFTGLYPILKYAIEARVPRGAQRLVKLLYWNLCLLAGCLLVRFVLFHELALPGFWRMLMLWFLANVLFQMYDTGLSRLIATLRRTLPPL